MLNKVGDDESYMPDFILYVGGTLVSKRLKQFLRLAVKKGAKVWRASTDGDYIDTFMRIDRIFQCDTTLLADAMTSYDLAYQDDECIQRALGEGTSGGKAPCFRLRTAIQQYGCCKGFPNGISGSFAG